MDRIDSLRLFIDIIERGSLSAAAHARGLSPSTVTITLQALEELAGVTLITRTTRQLSLTNEGEVFLESCRDIVERFDTVLEDLRATGPLEGQIRITATNDFGRNHLLDLIESFKSEHPGVSIALHLSDDVVDLIEAGFDLGIRTGPLKDSLHQFELLVRGPRKICASPDYWDRMGRPTHPRELAEHNCLVLQYRETPSNKWRVGDDVVRVSGDRSSNDGEVLKEWASRGAGVVLKSWWDVRAELKSGVLEAVLEERMTDEINLYAVYPGGHRTPRRVEAFIRHLLARVSRE